MKRMEEVKMKKLRDEKKKAKVLTALKGFINCLSSISTCSYVHNFF